MSDWKNVQYKDGKMRTSEGGGGGGSSTFAGLDDVSFSDIQNGQVPKYNSDTGKWENANESGGGGTVTDVEVDGVSVVNPQGVAEIETPDASGIEYDNQQSGLQATDVQSAIDELAQSSGGGGVEDVEVNGVSVVNAQNVAEIKSYKEVTQAEYQALPSTKLTDNILYCIKDSAGADGFPPLIYSDEEREVGVWRDGKPLYQRTFIGACPNHTGQTIIQTLNEEIQAKTISGYVEYAQGNSVFIPNYESSTWKVIFSIATVNGVSTLRIEVGSDLFNKPFYATLQYTKTTDTAGSGTWTTQGGYAHHYSTSEKVIGTWIDSKPIYEKTITGGSVSTNQEVHIDVSSLNIERMVGIDSGGTYFVRNDQSVADIPLSYNVPQNASYGISVGLYGTTLNINTGAFPISSYAITLRYTKTTD